MASLPQVLPQLVAGLDVLCAPKCTTAVTKLATELTGSVCAAEIFDPASNTTGSLYGSALILAGSIACVKTNGTYCLLQEAEAIAPLVANLPATASSDAYIAALTPLISNTTFLCSECVVKQATNVAALSSQLDPSISAFIAPLGSLVNSCPASNGTATASAPTATTSARSSALTAFSGAALAVVVIAAAF